MSPELFSNLGVHSYQSDFWALGCVLYYLRRGFLPFGRGEDYTLSQFLNNISKLDPIEEPIGFKPDKDEKNAKPPQLSSSLSDLLQWLLEKQPMNRCEWKDICNHPFWENPLTPPQNLPVNIHYNEYVKKIESEKDLLLERDSLAEFNLSDVVVDTYKKGGDLLQVVSIPSNSNSSSNSNPPHLSTPLKLPPTVDSTPMRGEGLKKNSMLIRERDEPIVEENYRVMRESQNLRGSELDKTVVHNNGTTTINIFDQSPNKFNEIITPDRNIQDKEKAYKNDKSIRSTPERKVNSELIQNNKKEYENNLPSKITHTFSLPNYISPLKISLNHNTIPHTWYCHPDSLLLHSSDINPKPIFSNESVEKIENFSFNPKELPFTTYNLNDFNTDMTLEIMDQHLNNIKEFITSNVLEVNAYLNYITGNANMTGVNIPSLQRVLQLLLSRINLLSYLFSISSNVEFTNLVLDSTVLTQILNFSVFSFDFTTNSNESFSTKLFSLPFMINNFNFETNDSNKIATILFHTARYISISLIGSYARHANNFPTSSPTPNHSDINKIINVLIKIIQRKEDIRLSLRSLAALGELIFYKAAQDDNINLIDDNTYQSDFDQVISILFNEILASEVSSNDPFFEFNMKMKHYVIKTLENVFVQGGTTYKFFFVSSSLVKNIIKYCDSRYNYSNYSLINNLIQTSLVTISHIFYFIMFSYKNPVVHKIITFYESNNNPCVLSFPIYLSSSKFLFDHCSQKFIQWLLEKLNDLPPKSQQVILNIINLILSDPLFSIRYTNFPKDSFIDIVNEADKLYLNNLREFIVNSSNLALLVPSLINLLEQASLHPLRAKALLTFELLPYHAPDILKDLAKKRFQYVLVKGLEPLLSQIDPRQKINTNINSTNLNYNQKIPLSFLLFLQISLCTHLKAINSILLTLLPSSSSINLLDESVSPSTCCDYYLNFLKDNKINLVELNNRIKISTDYIKNLISIISTTSLINLIITPNAIYIDYLGSNFKLLILLARILEKSNILDHSSDNILQNEKLLEIIQSVQLVSLSCLELFNYPNVLDEITSPLNTNSTLTLPSELFMSSSYVTFHPERIAPLKTFVTNLLPPACEVFKYPDFNVRIAFANTLRKIIPSYLTIYFSLASSIEHENIYSQIFFSIKPILKDIKLILSYDAPIPEYILRLFTELLEANRTFNDIFSQSISNSPQMINILINTYLKFFHYENCRLTSSQQYYGSYYFNFLRTYFDSNRESIYNLFKYNFIPSFSDALKGTITKYIVDHNKLLGQLSKKDSFGSPSSPTSLNLHQSNHSHLDFDVLASSINFAHTVLHYSLKVSHSNPQDNLDKNSKFNKILDPSELINLISPLAKNWPIFLFLMYYIDTIILPSIYSNSSKKLTQGSDFFDDPSSYFNLLETVSRCLGILFDLFPYQLTDLFINNKTYNLSDMISNEKAKFDLSLKTVATPLKMFSIIISDPLAPPKVQLKMLKILNGFIQIRGKNMVELLKTSPHSSNLFKALQIWSNTTPIKSPTNQSNYDIILFQQYSEIQAPLCQFSKGIIENIKSHS